MCLPGMEQDRVLQTSAVKIVTLLLVEGDVLVRAPLANYLRTCGYRVLEAASAKEARMLLAANHTRIELVFVDASLSGAENGFALAQWVRQDHPNIRVLLAGSITDAAQKAGKLCEGGPMLAKPYTPDIVLARIQRLLHQVRKDREPPR